MKKHAKNNMKKNIKAKTNAPKRKIKSTASRPLRKRSFPPLAILDWEAGPAIRDDDDVPENESAAHFNDIPDIRDDLRTLGDRLLKLESLVAALEFTHPQAIAELERKLIATQQRLELTVALGKQITRLEEWLTSGAIQKDLQQLCERQLTAIDKRLAELPARTDRANQGAKSNE